MSSLLLALPHRIGAVLLSIADQTGGVAILCGQIIRRLFPPKIDGFELLRNMYRMCYQSLPIVCGTAVFTGALMIIQAAPFVVRFNAKSFIGWGATFTTLRELGPLLIGMMFNGRVGANNAAELGTMVVTDQIDALRALAIDPITYLVIPRALTITFSMVLLVIIGDFVAVLGAMLCGYLAFDVHPAMFLNSALPMLEPWDFEVGVIKAFLFGIMIALTSCYYGLSTKGGAPGVGRAVNAAVVAAASGIYIADYFSTFILE